MIDRLGARRMLTPCIAVVVIGLVGIAPGIIYPGAVAVVIARAFLASGGPVYAIRGIDAPRGGS
jgi:nitrate/nitrite transporter NarK